MKVKKDKHVYYEDEAGGCGGVSVVEVVAVVEVGGFLENEEEALGYLFFL